MRFKEGDSVVSAKFDRFDEWKGLTVSVAHSDWAAIYDRLMRGCK